MGRMSSDLSPKNRLCRLSDGTPASVMSCWVKSTSEHFLVGGEPHRLVHWSLAAHSAAHQQAPAQRSA
jgi:hypothetical protein